MLMAALLLAATISAPSAPVAAAPVADPVSDLLAQLNAERVAAGLAPLRAEPALLEIAGARAEEVARTQDFDGSPETIRALTQDLRVAGYPPYSWRQRLVQGPHDATALVRQWKSSDPQGFTAVVLGDYEGFGAAVAPGSQPPLWSLLVALPRLSWERRLAAPLDSVEDIREQVLLRLNDERLARHLPPLALDPAVQRAAEAHATDMATRRFYDHTTPEGHDLGWRLHAIGYDSYRWAAENIAKGLFTPTEVVDRWMLSSGHRRNILSPQAKQVGIAVARTEEDGHVTALWVLDFSG